MFTQAELTAVFLSNQIHWSDILSMRINESLMQKDQEITWLLEQALRAGLSLADWSACLQKITKLQRWASTDEGILFFKARALCALERFSEAEPILQGLLNCRYERSGIYHCLGMITLNRGMLSASVEYFSKAIARNEANILDPSIRQNFAGRAQAFNAQGLDDKAVRDFGVVEQLVALERANDLYIAGRYSRAQQNIENLGSDLRGNRFAQIPLIRCFIAQGEYSAAIALASKIIDSDAMCSSAYFYRAIACFFVEQNDRCISDLSYLLEGERCLLMVELIPTDSRMRIFDNIDGRMLRAQALSRTSQFMEAMRDLDYIIMRRPSWQAYMDRSNAASGLALYGTAYGDAQAALAIEPNSLDTQEQYRRCQLQLSKQSEGLNIVTSSQAQGSFTKV